MVITGIFIFIIIAVIAIIIGVREDKEKK